VHIRILNVQECDATNASSITELMAHDKIFNLVLPNQIVIFRSSFVLPATWQQICGNFLMNKAFNLSIVLKQIEKAVKPYPKAAMFELYERGYNTLFEQLISCIISIRTLDETTIPLSEKLFEIARTPKKLLKLSPKKLEDILHGATFPGQKAYTMLGIAKAAIKEYKGELPASFEKLTGLKGVGPKCANLALGVAHKQAAISVDVHVHRVVNRWGFIETKTPEQTMLQLQQKVPQQKWIDINRLLMPFGKHICTGRFPHCCTCPVLEFCRQIGVTSHR
jgi:endonuclease-3